MIVGLGHQAQVGKDTAAQILVDKYGFRRRAFADALKDLAYRTNPIIQWMYGHGPIYLADIVDQQGWEEAKKNWEVRRYLQNLGLGARHSIHQDVWVDIVLDHVSWRGHYVITDVRFPNEFNAIRSEPGSKLIKLTRDGSGAGNHESEVALEDYPWDAVIENNGTLDELEAELIKVIDPV